jgi:hypothetical protein
LAAGHIIFHAAIAGAGPGARPETADAPAPAAGAGAGAPAAAADAPGDCCGGAPGGRGQGLTVVHFSASLEPFLTRHTPCPTESAHVEPKSGQV